MSTLKTVKQTSVITLMAILLMVVATLAQAGENSGYLGVILQDINSGMAKAMDLDNSDGVLVSKVVDDSPADKAGLKAGDVIIKFQGEDLADHSALTKAVKATSPGEKVEVVVLRDGKKKTLKVELGQREDGTMAFYSDDGDVHFSHGDDNVFVWSGDKDDKQIEIIIKDLEDMHQKRGFMGVEVDDINEQMGKYFDVDHGEGALITSVTEDSAAENAGLEAGDVIIRIGDDEIETASDVHAALAGTEPDQELEIKVVRKGKNKTMDITLGEVPDSQMFRQIEMISNDNNFFIASPKTLHHGMSKPHQVHKEMRIILEDETELKEMRKELEKMKLELKKMQAELKNK